MIYQLFLQRAIGFGVTAFTYFIMTAAFQIDRNIGAGSRWIAGVWLPSDLINNLKLRSVAIDLDEWAIAGTNANSA